MSALDPRRRPPSRTAREVAEKLGVSERTVYRLVAERRRDYEARAKKRREHVSELRLRGLTYQEIADRTGASVGSVGRLLYDARRNGEWNEALAARDAAPVQGPASHAQ